MLLAPSPASPGPTTDSSQGLEGLETRERKDVARSFHSALATSIALVPTNCLLHLPPTPKTVKQGFLTAQSGRGGVWSIIREIQGTVLILRNSILPHI